MSYENLLKQKRNKTSKTESNPKKKVTKQMNPVYGGGRPLTPFYADPDLDENEGDSL